MAQAYSDLQGHLDRVRWAWKRAAAVQGFSAVVIEGIGMFLLFVLLDYVYVMPQPVRVLTLAAMGAILAFLFVRHVVRPILRVIPDDQVALYIEERQQETEGALLSATAFGKDAKSDSPVHDFIISNIVAAAVSKAGSIQLSKLLNLAKLRKYGIAALIVLLFFGLSALRYSSFFGHRASRLLMPWQMSQEDLRDTGAMIEAETKMKIDLTLTPGGNRVLRGSAVNIKAKLSRMPDADVVLKFRTKGAVDFQQLKMDEIDELNAFAMRLPDINDDLEIFAQCGKNGKNVSESITVTVYDQLSVKGYEVTLFPPAYTKQKPTTEFGAGGDITALIGTKVQIRALANAPLATGELVFEDGKKLTLTGETSGDRAAKGEFIIEKDTSYTVRVAGVDAQTSDTSTSFAVKAVKDEPPTVQLVTPAQDTAVHRAAEIEFRAKVNDDVGVASAEVVYSLPDNNDKTERIPFKIDEGVPGEHEVSVYLPLGDIKHPVAAGDTIFYHLEVKDMKGQPAISDMYELKIQPFEIAGAFPITTGSHHHPHPPSLDLMVFIGAAWNIETQKDYIEKNDYDSRCDSLHAKMVNPDGTPKKFKQPKITLLPPDKQEMVKEGNEWVKKGIATLNDHKAGEAVTQLRKAIALWDRATTGLDFKDKQEIEEIGEKTENAADPMQAAMGFLKMAPKMEQESPKYEVDLPEYRRQIKPQDAKQLREEADELKKREEKILAEAKKQAATKPSDHPNDNQNKTQNPAQPQEPNKEQKEQKGGGGAPQNNNQEQKTAEAKNPDEKNPDAKNGEQKPEQANGGQNNDEKTAQNQGKPQPANNNNQDPNHPENADGAVADQDERKAALQRDQDKLAEDAKKFAAKAAAKMPKVDKNTKDVLDHFRNSVAAMEQAAAQIKLGNMQQAAAKGEEAKSELGKGADKLQASQYDNLDPAVAAAEERGNEIAEAQKRIQEQTQKVLDGAKARAQKENPGKPVGDPKLNGQEQQKIKGLAQLQVENQAKAENLETYVNDLAKWAEGLGKKDAAQALNKAAKTMKQENMVQTMVTAAVNIAQHEFGDAADSQDKLNKTMGKINNELRNANSSLAGTTEEKIKRALNEAKDIQTKVDKLTGKEGDKNDPNAKGQEDKQANAQKPDGKNDGKNDPNAKGQDDKQANAQKPDGKNDGKNDPNAKGQDDKQANAQKPDGKNDGKNDPNAKGQDDKQANAQKPDGKNDGKKDPNAKGPDDKQTAAQNDKNDKNGENGGEGKNTKTADAKNGNDNNNKNEKGEKKELSEGEKQALRNEIFRDTARLARRLDQDKLAEATVSNGLRETVRDERSFEDMFKEGQKTKLDGYIKNLKSVSNHLEGKLESVLKAKRLATSQREQTPAQYRDMVNKYYEQLSKE